MRLQDRVAVVTGAAGGIGEAVAKAFANEGASLIAADINLEGAVGTVDAISRCGGEAVSFELDITKRADCQKVVDIAVKEFKRLDILVNAAGVGSFGHFNEITPEEAISHPVWNMGPKISVDSSTMMNKCLEIIEARWLFNNKNIEVLIHPEGIVHSLVEFVDKSLVAQLSVPDMKIPIAYGLGYPSKIDSAASSVNFEIFSNLSFRQPDFQKFPSLNLARQCIEEGGNSPIVINAVNEVSVDAFLKGKIGYLDIYNLISEILDKTDIKVVKKVEDIFEQDKQSRAMAMELIGTY